MAVKHLYLLLSMLFIPSEEVGGAEPEPVSVAYAAENRNLLDNQTVAIYGILVVEFENIAVYPSREAVEHARNKAERQAIWIDPALLKNYTEEEYEIYKKKRAVLTKFHLTCVIITGPFSASGRGHMSLYDAEIGGYADVKESSLCDGGKKREAGDVGS
ncbi:MAG TPA: hypothetical protein VF275_11290 [Gammaproteobacteria bacterium]